MKRFFPSISSPQSLTILSDTYRKSFLRKSIDIDILVGTSNECLGILDKRFKFSLIPPVHTYEVGSCEGLVGFHFILRLIVYGVKL